MQRDLFSQVKEQRGIDPAAAITDNTALVSQILDVAGFDSAMFVGCAGSIADADVVLTFLLEESAASDMSGANTVAASDMIGTALGAAPLFSDDNKTFKLGYKGSKRYLRLTITPSANTGNLFIAGVWLLGHPRRIPQSTQVV